MVAFLTQLLLGIRSRFSRRALLEADNLILRQPLIVLRRRRPRRVRLWNIDRVLLVWLYRLYPSLLDAIIIVQPETVIRWHRRGFRATGTGSPATSAAVHGLIPRFER
jgi:putative transposase